MADAPDRIWADLDNLTWVEDFPGEAKKPEESEYLRLDGPTLTEVREALTENVRLMSLVVRDLTGRVEAGKLAALYQCLERDRAALAKLEGK